MKKIVIHSTGSQDADNLVKWIGMLFPECEIHVRQGPYVQNPYESSCDNKIAKKSINSKGTRERMGGNR